jgi:hypothetical protein
MAVLLKWNTCKFSVAQCFSVGSYEELYFMQGGVPPHFSVPVRAWLDNSFTGRWIGRGGSTRCPPRNLDIIVFNLFLLGWMKEETHPAKPGKLYELEKRIPGTFIPVPLGFLWKSVQSVSSRLQKCVHSAGSYVEMSH